MDFRTELGSMIRNGLRSLSRVLTPERLISSKLWILLVRGVDQLSALYEELWAILLSKDETLARECAKYPRKYGMLAKVLTGQLEVTTRKREIFTQLLDLLQDFFADILDHLSRINEIDLDLSKATEFLKTVSMMESSSFEYESWLISFSICKIPFTDWDTGDACALLESLLFSIQRAVASPGSPAQLTLNRQAEEAGVPERL